MITRNSPPPEFFAGVHVNNGVGAALVRRAGFAQVTDGPDVDGFTYFALRRNGGVSPSVAVADRITPLRRG